jgi:hypothetical protein
MTGGCRRGCGRWIWVGNCRRAGFVDAEVVDRPAWRLAEQALWREALTVEAGDDPAVRSMQEEAQRVLATFDGLRRVLATARAPHSAQASPP